MTSSGHCLIGGNLSNVVFFFFFFSIISVSSGDPHRLHSLNREKLFNSLRDHLTSCARPLQGFVFLQGGEEQTRHCTDHLELFRQESYFVYLFGVEEPGFYGAIVRYDINKS
ncbi:hypothetical protein HAX54_021496 [Datura stramonium]|uniref:Aminopeptidase P N-terminal domain-containing protein n=1 Tax=Datura stramonium TaxID=4076 RepID=A0ABS8UUZ5_DATST|nr:hypothetical protein [Datura stramonium]